MDLEELRDYNQQVGPKNSFLLPVPLEPPDELSALVGQSSRGRVHAVLACMQQVAYAEHDSGLFTAALATCQATLLRM